MKNMCNMNNKKKMDDMCNMNYMKDDDEIWQREQLI